jgi:hypothetical protein
MHGPAAHAAQCRKLRGYPLDIAENRIDHLRWELLRQLTIHGFDDVWNPARNLGGLGASIFSDNAMGAGSFRTGAAVPLLCGGMAMPRRKGAWRKLRPCRLAGLPIRRASGM